MQIYYYTRTGRSKLIADKLATQYNTTVNAIEDKENWNGVLGFLKGGAKASKKESLDIIYEKPSSTDDIVVVFPVWAGTFPPAVKRFVEENPCEQITLVPTSLGSKLKNRDGFKKVIDLVGKDIMNIEINL